LHDFHLLEFSHQPVPSQCTIELKQQGDGAGETSRTTNYELHEKCWTIRAPFSKPLLSVLNTSMIDTVQ
jgi:hypothetical protein